MIVSFASAPCSFKIALNERVHAYLLGQPQGRFAGTLTKLKCSLIGAALLGVYAAILLVVEQPATLVALMIALGVLQLMLVFNVGHDAAHGAFSADRRMNTLLRYTWDVAGISSHCWSLRHNIAHHGFTNVMGVDLDIEQGFFLRLNPGETWRSFHRGQRFYAPIIYSLFTLYLATLRDFQILARERIGNRKILHHGAGVWAEVCVGKALYYAYMLVIPVMVTDLGFAWILSAWLLMHLVAGTITMMLAAPPHLAVGNLLERPPADGKIPRSFAEHQLLSTSDMAPRSRLLIAFCGGLNVQVIHHLFPNVAHTHHRALTSILRQVAAQHGLEYRSRSVHAALRDHYAHLELMGRPPAPVPG